MDMVGKNEGENDGDALILGSDDGWVVIVGLVLGLLERTSSSINGFACGSII